MPHAIDLSTVQSVTKILKKDILISPATLSNDMLTRIGFRTITGVTNVESEFISLSYNGAIRPYDMTESYDESNQKEVAKIVERKLKTYLAFRAAGMNIQSFKEKEPFEATDKVDESSLMRLPQTTFALLQAGENYGQEVLQSVFFGDRKKGNKSPYGIFDGLYVQIAKDMTSYQDEDGNEIPVLISKENGNLIETSPITKPTSTTDYSAYEVFESFVENLDPSLADNPEGVLVLCSKKRAPWIYQAYMNRYPNLQASVKYDQGYQFFTVDGITLVGTPLMGDTDMLIATVPNNFSLGIESERNDNNVFVKQHSFDPNKINLWIQSAQGVRLDNPTKSHFAVSCDSEGNLHEATPLAYGDLQIAAE
jgi:hypothetical protein